MNYFVIIAEGEYSQYQPTYFIGEREITQKKLEKWAKKIAFELVQKFNEFPKRINNTDVKYKGEWESYDPETNNTIHKPDFKNWFNIMEEWLTLEGFVQLPKNIPEVRVKYELEDLFEDEDDDYEF